MAKIDLKAIVKEQNNMVCSLKGQKIEIYGDSDTGKTFQATRMEKPLLLMSEAGGNGRNCPKVFLDSWDTFTDVVKQLTTNYDEMSKDVQTIIVDTVEELVSLCENKVAKRYGVLEVGMVQGADKGNPNGYSLARNMFRQQINLLSGMGYTVIFISHTTEIEDYEDPDTHEVYNKIMPYGSNKEKGSTKFVRNLVDFCIYTKAQGVDKASNKTIYSKAICKETKHIFARARYDMQTEIPVFTAENLEKAILEAIQRTAENEGAGLVEFEQVKHGYTKEDYFGLIKPYIDKIYPLYPDFVISTIAEQLGENRKITDATDDEITELGNIYSDFVAYASDRGIEV